VRPVASVALPAVAVVRLLAMLQAVAAALVAVEEAALLTQAAVVVAVVAEERITEAAESEQSCIKN